MSDSSSIDTFDSAAAKAQQAAAAAKKGGKDAQSDSVKSFLSGGAGGISAVLVGESEHEHERAQRARARAKRGARTWFERSRSVGESEAGAARSDGQRAGARAVVCSAQWVVARVPRKTQAKAGFAHKPDEERGRAGEKRGSELKQTRFFQERGPPSAKGRGFSGLNQGVGNAEKPGES